MELLLEKQLFPPFFDPVSPAPGILGAIVTIFQVFLVLTSYSTELNSPTEYSKFASAKQKNPISSQNGMFRIYIPSALVASALWVKTSGNADAFSVVVPLLAVHFWKRTLEVAFVHRYSGTMPAASGNTIGTYYALFTFMISSWAVPDKSVNDDLKLLGMILFGIGLVGNGYHHWLLSKLRSTIDPASKKKKYVPPHGGLFGIVAAPHYFFELVGWLGLALVAQQLNAFLTFGSMTAYLAARATMTNQQYMDDFSKEEWPRSCFALIPLVF